MYYKRTNNNIVNIVVIIKNNYSGEMIEMRFIFHTAA